MQQPGVLAVLLLIQLHQPQTFIYHKKTSDQDYKAIAAGIPVEALATCLKGEPRVGFDKPRTSQTRNPKLLQMSIRAFVIYDQIEAEQRIADLGCEPRLREVLCQAGAA